MARYVDPTDTAYLDLSLGWCLDRFSSSLTSLVFLRWDRPAESLHVIVHPPDISAEAPLDQWLESVAKGLPAGTPLTRLECGEGHAVAATLIGQHGTTRVAFIRGLRLVATVEHRGAGNDAQATSVLSDAVASLFIPVNHHLPASVSLSRALELQDATRTALERGDVKTAVTTLIDALDVSRKAWLASLAGQPGLPDLNAAESIAIALAAMGKLGKDPIFLRQGEEIIFRVRRLVPRLPLPESTMRRWDDTCAERLAQLAILQFGLFGIKDPRPRPVRVLDERAHFMLKHAQASFEKRLPEALRQACVALDDYLLEFTKIAQQQRPVTADNVVVGDQTLRPEDILLAYRNDVARRAATTAHLIYLDAMGRQDSRGAREASGLVLALSECSLGADADDADRRAHAIAMMAHAGALLFSADDVSLADADSLLAQVRVALDALPRESLLRAEYCRNHAWVKHYLKDAAGGAALCDEGLAAFQQVPADERDDGGERLRRSLASLHSQFLLNAGDTEAALVAARSAVDTATPISSNLLNLALCEDKAGLKDDALRSLRRALEVSLPDNPLGQDVLRILFVASALVERRDMKIALDLHHATEALLDAQRAQFASGDIKLAYDEAEHHREVAQTLVGRLIDVGDYGAALEAADRGRARVLIELLGDRPDAASEKPQDVLGAAPPLDAEPIRAFGTAAAFVRRAAAHTLLAAGAPLPLDRLKIFETAKSVGRPLLLMQPERGRLHMFCVLPEDHVIVTTSPVPLDEIYAAIRTAQSALGVFAVARSRSGGRLKLVDIDDNQASALDTALDKLSHALIAPFSEHLAKNNLLHLVLSGRGLTLVPYRELALVPFALLRAPTGRLLIEEAPLSQMPSIASLRALLRRPRPTPQRCVVYGAPFLDPRHQLDELPGAAKEATLVADLLAKAGVVSPAFRARLGREASESAFRQDALDAGLVHLACHAAAREPASQSALYLAPSATHDGLLVPHEIADGELANALVFLSACQTGLGRPTADGVIGLGRAFLQAGALGVVLSLWRVADAAAAYLAEAFYRAALGIDERPVPVAAALQSAMLATRDALRAGRIKTVEGEVLDDHPAHWAPFALLGEGGLPLRTTLASIGASAAGRTK